MHLALFVVQSSTLSSCVNDSPLTYDRLRIARVSNRLAALQSIEKLNGMLLAGLANGLRVRLAEEVSLLLKQLPACADP